MEFVQTAVQDSISIQIKFVFPALNFVALVLNLGVLNASQALLSLHHSTVLLIVKLHALHVAQKILKNVSLVQLVMPMMLQHQHVYQLLIVLEASAQFVHQAIPLILENANNVKEKIVQGAPLKSQQNAQVVFRAFISIIHLNVQFVQKVVHLVHQIKVVLHVNLDSLFHYLRLKNLSYAQLFHF